MSCLLSVFRFYLAVMSGSPAFSLWLPSLSTIIAWCIHVAAKGILSFYGGLILQVCVCVCVCATLSVPFSLSVDILVVIGHPCCPVLIGFLETWGACVGSHYVRYASGD